MLPHKEQNSAWKKHPFCQWKRQEPHHSACRSESEQHPHHRQHEQVDENRIDRNLIKIPCHKRQCRKPDRRCRKYFSAQRSHPFFLIRNALSDPHDAKDCDKGKAESGVPEQAGIFPEKRHCGKCERTKCIIAPPDDLCSQKQQEHENRASHGNAPSSHPAVSVHHSCRYKGSHAKRQSRFL